MARFAPAVLKKQAEVEQCSPSSYLLTQRTVDHGGRNDLCGGTSLRLRQFLISIDNAFYLLGFKLLQQCKKGGISKDARK